MICKGCGRKITPADEAKLGTGYDDNVQVVIFCDCGQEYEAWIECWMPIDREEGDPNE